MAHFIIKEPGKIHQFLEFIKIYQQRFFKILNFTGYSENIEKGKTFKLAYLEEVEQIVSLLTFVFSDIN